MYIKVTLRNLLSLLIPALPIGLCDNMCLQVSMYVSSCVYQEAGEEATCCQPEWTTAAPPLSRPGERPSRQLPPSVKLLSGGLAAACRLAGCNKPKVKRECMKSPPAFYLQLNKREGLTVSRRHVMSTPEQSCYSFLVCGDQQNFCGVSPSSRSP